MSGAPAAVERLAFTLPDFNRRSWVSERARQVWEPRLERIRRAWLEVEWRSVVDGVRPCALIGIAHGELAAIASQWTAHRLSAVGLPMPARESHPGLVLAAVGSLDDVNRARDAWNARADDALGRLFGYPACCRAFFQTVWTGHGATDTTWGMATNTAAPDDAVVTVDAGDAPPANVLWRWLGVRAVPHLPCRFDCSDTARLAAQLRDVALRAGFVEEVDWIEEILSWPVEWSALHGIAEIKTPIIKISARTDATARKYVVRVKGRRYPAEGATGLRFPYQPPTRQPMAEGRRFQIGLKPPSERPAAERSWYHRDNGFASLEAMNELHRPIVALARSALQSASGRVLDLGCGNGALLAKICEGRRELRPHGVDRNPVALEHARVLLPGMAGSFTAADLFDCDAWRDDGRAALTLVMIGRLLEVERPVAERLLSRLRASSDAILLYSYPGSPLVAEAARQLGLALEDSPDATAALLKRPPPIDWTRLAEPQADEYDTNVILRLASTTASAERPQPYRRAPVGDSPSLFDGEVAVRHVYRGLPEFDSMSAHYPDAPADHPNLRTAAELVRSWPVAFTQCQRLFEAIHPAFDDRVPLASAELYRGSSCHSYERLFGTMWATIYCPIGLAEAFVHELAHQKLRVLGVSFESATAIVGNDPPELYVSPVVKDRRRPMTAVLHAQYSYVHVTALDVHLLSAERDPERRAQLEQVLARNLARIEEGRETLARHFEPGEHGRAFMDGLARWTESTIAAAKALLAGPPLPSVDTSARRVVALDREAHVSFAFAPPSIVLLGDVLSADECDALIAYCEPRLERSPVVGDAEGNVQLHQNRTSRGVMLRREETPLIAAVEARLAALARWPIERGEGLNVLRYDVGEEYRGHFDSFDPQVPGLRKHLTAGGQRLGTFILYLSDVEAGGETSFPAIGLDVKPRKGSALFFLNTDARRLPDARAFHAGRPVIKGVKYIANKWLRERDC